MSLKQLRKLRTRTSKNGKICYRCRAVYLNAIEKARDDVWERIDDVCMESED